jgi:hypothetical protein
MAKKIKKEVMEYEFTNKKFSKVNAGKTVPSDPKTPVISSSAVATNNMDPARIQFLRGNPFSYNSKKSAFQVSSIEDYLVKVRREDLALGDIVRSSNFKKSKKKTIVKHAFRNWEKQYNSQKKHVFDESDRTIDVIGDVNFMNIPFGTKMMIFGLFILMIFMISPNAFFWQKIAESGFGYRINQLLISTYQSTSWLKIVGNLTVYILIIFIFYASIYSMVSMDFVKDHKMAVDYLKRSEKIISKQYKKKSQKARKYYLSMITSHKKHIQPMDMKEVEEGRVNITTFDNIRKISIDRAYKLKKSRPIYIGLKNLFLFLSIGGSATVIGYSLFKMVMSLF